MTQAELRRLKRQQRQTIPVSKKILYSQQMAETFLSSKTYQHSQCLGVYLALPEEVNTSTIIETAWTDNKQVYLPVVIAKGQAMGFAPYFPDSTLIKDAMNIPIPDCDVSDYISATQLDSIITPLVAFDSQAHRIGMGGGFYDRTFAFKRDNPQLAPQLIGIAFEAQRSDIPIVTANWDIPLNCIITEKAVYPS